ncbi:WLM domain-containing protein [Melampsora americana]|nr:WLM domain-containing protein [Melampsora americana]
MPRFNSNHRDHPNPYINFIRVLGDDGRSGIPLIDSTKENARQIMKAISAQVLPIMKEHGMGLNTFTEYKWNSEFAGRNWNGGETIELVLRKKNGQFLPMGYLLSVMAHELAHIHHMNHGPQFQKLNTKLRSEIRQLQAKGYYGPGFWSSGQRLKDSATSVGDGALVASDLPQYTCGGSNTQGTRRRVYKPKTTTTRTSRRKRTAQQFIGDGQKLDNDGPSSFRKRANAAGAKETRAQAAELRLRRAGIMNQSPTLKPEVQFQKSKAHFKQESKGKQRLGSSEASGSKRRSNSVEMIDISKAHNGSEEDEEEDDEIEIVKLEAEWEDFKESDRLNLSSPDQVEAERKLLRDEMNELREGYEDLELKVKDFKPSLLPDSKYRSLEKRRNDDDDEIQLLGIKKEDHKMTKRKNEEEEEEEVQAKKRAGRIQTGSSDLCSSSSVKPVGSNSKRIPLESMIMEVSGSKTWKCNICCMEVCRTFSLDHPI